jgi:hypothetical protein
MLRRGSSTLKQSSITKSKSQMRSSQTKVGSRECEQLCMSTYCFNLFTHGTSNTFLSNRILRYSLDTVNGVMTCFYNKVIPD